MSSLSEGKSYGLASGGAADHLEFLQVKLTDTSSKIIDEYLSNLRMKGGASAKAHIKVTGSTGSLQIPAENGMRTFNLSLAPLSLDVNGSCQCVHQSSRGAGLKIMGEMTQKIQVGATNDSFANTKLRMTQADEDSKKNCAKEIKPGAPGIGKRTKKRIVAVRPDLLVPKARADLGDFRQSVSSSRVSPSLPAASHDWDSSPTQPEQRALTTGQHPANIHKAAASRMRAMKAKGTAMAIKAGHKTAPPEKAKPKPAVDATTLPLRDRVIHLLATRPYSRPEVIIRLQKDGLPEGDKSKIDEVLGQVAKAQPKSHALSLRPELYEATRADWPFYTMVDRQLLMREKQRALARLQESLEETSRSPPTSAQHPQTKISPKTSPGSETSSSKAGSPEDLEVSRLTAHVNEDSTGAQEVKRVLPDKKDEDEQAVSSTKRARLEEDDESQVSSTVNGHSGSDEGKRQEDKEEGGDSPQEASCTTPDYIADFTAIADAAQRTRYRECFNANYSEYIELHKSVNAITTKFTELEKRVAGLNKASDEYMEVKQQILQEYDRAVSLRFQEQRERYKYLHARLMHIKSLIVAYDNSVVAQSRS